MQYAIEAEGLVKSYPKGVKALDGLSFAVAAGTVFALLGPNGAGKSTAVKILTTLAKPDAGKALVTRLDVTEYADSVRRTIGVVAQGSGVDIQATGRENLRLQGQIHGIRGRAIEDRAQDLLERFGLADAADRVARGYSGGMQRRLDIAMALVHDPAVLFLDEPTTGLDPEVRADMWSEIGNLARGRGKTVLLTTHYLEEADQLADRLAIVDRGKVVAQGSPDELKRELRGDAIHVDLEAEYNGTVTRALGGLPAIRDVTVDGRALRARADDGGRAVPLVLQALETHGVEVSSVRVSRPSLDDVYLKYTGRTFDAAEAEAVRMTLIRHTLYMTLRHLRELWRQPWFVAVTLVQPVIWLLLFGALFKRIIEIPGFHSHSYIAFLAPGVVVMTAMFNSAWSGMALIDDLGRGVTARFLVSPVRREALIAGRILKEAVVVVIQSVIIVVLALIVGASFPGGVAGVAALFAVSALLGATFGALSNGFALIMRQEEALIGAVQFIVLPLTFLSTTFLAANLIPGWMKRV